MVNVSTPQFCPYCEDPLYTDEQLAGFKSMRINKDRCPNCYKIVKNPNNKYFEKPKYIFHQSKSLIENLERDKLKPGSDDYLDQVTEISNQEIGWYRECLHEDRIAALSDAIGVMANLIFTRSMAGEIKQVLTLAKRVSTLASAIEDLHKSGVTLYDRETRSLRPVAGSSDGNQASATASRDP